MNLAEALRDQAVHCAALGSPFMARMLPMLAELWPAGSALDAAILAFEGNIGPMGHSLPLRLAAGLHALVLTGRDAGLIAAYPPHDVPDAAMGDALTSALRDHEAFMIDWITSPPQTNEVRRSAVLIPGLHHIAGITGATRVTMSELGASAGLNLMFDRFALESEAGRLGPDDPALVMTPDWDGPLPDAVQFEVVDRRGVDLNPLDPHDADHALRLRSYLWPDQPHRMALTDAAITANTAQVDRGDAVDWLKRRLEDVSEAQLHLIYHTIAWQYFPQERQETGAALIAQAGARATDASPLAWLRMEADEQRRGAAVTARIWPGDHEIFLGRADFHGRWVEWSAPRA